MLNVKTVWATIGEGSNFPYINVYELESEANKAVGSLVGNVKIVKVISGFRIYDEATGLVAEQSKDFYIYIKEAMDDLQRLKGGKKVKVFSHDDLDGLGCGILAKYAFGDRVNVTYCCYDTINEKVQMFLNDRSNLSKYSTIVITDISVKPEIATLLHSSDFELLLIDHHKTTLPLAKEYPWMKVELEHENGVLASGTSLFYEWLLEHFYIDSFKRTDSANDFVEMVRRWDTWDWFNIYDDQVPKQLNSLCFILGQERFVSSVLQKFNGTLENTGLLFSTSGINDYGKSFTFNKTELLLLELQEEELIRYYKKKEKQMTRVVINEYTAGLVTIERFHSEIGHLLNQNHDVDFVILVDLDNRKVSLRTNKNVDVSEIATQFGGGGHSKAAGCPLNDAIKEITKQALL